MDNCKMNIKQKSKKTINSLGTETWRLPNGQYHREDGPACTYSDGAQEWWLNGRCHREDGPAYSHPDGTQTWWLNGEIHREDGPACTYPNGTQEWWLNDRLIKRIKA